MPDDLFIRAQARRAEWRKDILESRRVVAEAKLLREQWKLVHGVRRTRGGGGGGT